MRCLDCEPGETACNPESAGGLCRYCHGAGGFALFDVSPSAWPSAPDSSPVPGLWPCLACNSTGVCPTCGGVGAINDDAWEDSLLQPY